jgi:hypothetical protein
MDKLEIKQGSFIQQTQYFIPVEIDLWNGHVKRIGYQFGAKFKLVFCAKYDRGHGYPNCVKMHRVASKN